MVLGDKQKQYLIFAKTGCILYTSNEKQLNAMCFIVFSCICTTTERRGIHAIDFDSARTIVWPCARSLEPIHEKK